MEFVISIVASVVTKITEPLLAPLGRPFGYLIHYDRNVKNLHEQADKLRDKQAGLRLDTDAAQRRGEVIAPSVESWLKQVDEVNTELGKFLEDVKVTPGNFNGRLPDLKSRYSLSRIAKKKIREIVKLLEDGKFDKTAYPAPPDVCYISTDSFMGFTSRINIMNRVLEALKDDKVNMVGICGMGGVGKTTLVKEVIKGVEREHLFDEIVMAVVSQTPNPAKIQGEIGDSIGLKLEEGSVSLRARRLRHRLKEIQKILIVLDDLWAEIDLENIGIPSKDDHHGCKIILASRIEDVCKKMKTQMNFRVSVLSEEEAWDLFQEIAGQLVDHAHMLTIAKEVSKECGGLPIAIVTVAKALRDKNKCVWEDALKQLKKSTLTSFSEMHECVFSRIELSYRYLKNEEARSCFLLCSLFPEDFSIPVEHLVRYGLGLRLFKGIDFIGDARNRVQTIVEKLKNSFLLMDSDKEECVKMHDVVRDVAISIASKAEYKFLVRCDSQMKEWPNDDTYGQYTASSIVFEKIRECAGSVKCPKLQLLQLSCRNNSQNVPYNLLDDMKELKVLALEGMSMLSQPSPLQVLGELRTLRLEHCEIKAALLLGPLEKLEVLSLFGSRILELPSEIGKLRRLRLLDATSCLFVKGIPPGVLSMLSQLEELYMRDSFYQWEYTKEEQEQNGRLIHPSKKRHNASFAELKCLPHLKALDIHIPDAKCLPNDMPFYKLTRFKISLHSGISEKGLYLFQNMLKIEADTASIMESGIYKLFRRTEVLSLNLTNLKNILRELDGQGFPCLKNLTLDSCSHMEYLIDSSSLFLHIAFPVLESLSLCKLANVKEIWHNHLPGWSSFSEALEEVSLCGQDQMPLGKESIQLPCFGNLKRLYVSGCSKLKNVFPVFVATSLVQLQDLYVGSCAEMEEIFFGEKEEDAFAFPKLTNLRLFVLPRLIGFWEVNPKQPILTPQGQLFVSCKLLTSQWISRLPSLEKFEVHGCKLLQVVFDLENINFEEGKEKIHSLVQLEEIRLYLLPELMHVWNQVPKGFQGFKRLKVLSVERCNNLKYVFSPSIAELLVELERISIEDCATMESIVAREAGKINEATSVITLHKVNYIHLRNLPNLESFCPDPYIFKLPSLNMIHLIECPKLKTFCSTITTKVMVTHIEHEVRTSSPIVPGVGTSDSSLSHAPYESFLKCFGCTPFHPTYKLAQGKEDDHVNKNVTGGKETQSCALLNVVDGYKHMQTLELSFCESVEIVFDLEETYASSVFNNLETLTLSYLPKLMHTWKTRIGKITGFQNLKQLEIHECNSLQNLMSSLVVRLLVKLEVIKITACELIEEIIARGEEEKVDKIVLPQLHSIILSELPNLIKFCCEISAIEFPKLVTMKMVGCPKVETFVSANVSSPRLKMILAETLSYPLEGDLNDTIQLIYKAKTLSEPIHEKLQFAFSHPQAGNDTTNLCSSSASYRRTESIKEAKGEIEFDGYENHVNKEFVGERNSDDDQLEGYRVEIKSGNNCREDETIRKKQANVDENVKGKKVMHVLVEDEARGNKRCSVDENDKVNVRVDTREIAKGVGDHIDGDNAEGRNVVKDDPWKEGTSDMEDARRNQGANFDIDSNINDHVSDNSSEGNSRTFLVPTTVIAERDNTMLLGGSSYAVAPNHEINNDPLVATTCRVDEGGTNLTQFRIGADFFGFEVESHYVSYLKRFYYVEGTFWDGCILKSRSGISFLLNMLGGALQTLDKLMKSLTYKELKLISNSIEDVSKAGFKVDSLMPVLKKVRMIIASQEKHKRYEYLVREMDTLEERRAELNSEIATLQKELNSEIVGVNFGINYFSIRY